MSEDSANVSFLPGSSFDLDFLADLYTQTFADYFYPCLVTPAELAEIVRIEQLDLDRCPVMLVEEKPVGFATLGIRGSESYCRGFGVIVPYRGKGLGHVLCEEMIRLARDAGARRMVLGVIKENIPALQTYRRAGFQCLREMVTLEWRADAGDAGRQGRKSTPDQVVEARPEDLLRQFEDLHTVRPVWDRDLPSLRERDDLRGLAVISNDVSEAHVLFREHGERAEIVDLGARAGGGSLQLAGSLLAKLQEAHPQLVCYNEPSDSPVLGALLASGFRETVCRLQLERMF